MEVSALIGNREILWGRSYCNKACIMEPRVPSKLPEVLSMFRQLFAFLPLVVAGVFPVARAATLNCNPTAVPAIVHAAATTERIGDLVFSCSGGTPSAA